MLADLENSITSRIKASPAQIVAFCQRWKIDEMALFGSVLQDDFRADSDIDILLTFSSYAGITLFDWMDIKEKLAILFGRKVDIADKRGLKNPFRRHEILKTCQVIYRQ